MRGTIKITEIIIFVLKSSAYMHQIAETKENVSQPCCANDNTRMTRKHNFDSVRADMYDIMIIANLNRTESAYSIDIES